MRDRKRTSLQRKLLLGGPKKARERQHRKRKKDR